MTKFIRKYREDAVPTVMIRTYPNQKPPIDGKTERADHHGKATGKMDMYKQNSYALRKAIKEAKQQYRDKVESQFNGSDMRRMWQGLQTISDYKGKASHVGTLTPRSRTR